MKKYIPEEIEKKWQNRWAKEGLYSTDLRQDKKHYVLAEFAYPSGDLHIGHWFTFCGADIYARLKRMQGYNVFFPNGFDAFGLPAENAAIKHGIHPQDWTMDNIARMKAQFSSMGASFSFDHEVVTCLPQFYKWNQWIFLKMREKGLAYKGKYLSNWCDNCQTVLANEGVEAGRCWRCDTQVLQKEVSQWFFKITDYADRLVWPEVDQRISWPKSVREGQNNWIGRSEGVNIKFKVKDSNLIIDVFTVYPETIFGVTYLVLAPEHHLAEELAADKTEARKYIDKSKKKSELERKLTGKDKTGVFTGSYCINPINNSAVPIWIADYIISTYGTGAVMGVPGSDTRDFAFAKKYNLPIIKVIAAKKGDLSEIKSEDDVLEGGFLVNSDNYDDLGSKAARSKITDYIKRQNVGSPHVQYHLRDWSVSRQRYWGTPVPIIHCTSCGEVGVPYEDLPVELPYDVDYQPKGKPPLATNEGWLKVKCPKCRGDAQRDPETLDTFVDSAWYFFRYLSPKLDIAPFDTEVAKRIMPVDIYFGGAEHTLGHTLYSRFLTKFFYDLGMIGFEEYALKRVNHGVVLGPDGQRMSKSRGNVISPDEQVGKYGADVVRLFLAFFMPYDATGPWDYQAIWGPHRFLERVWGLMDRYQISDIRYQISEHDAARMHQTIKKVTEDIEKIKFNTAVAALMEWVNYLGKKGKVSREEYKTLLLLLAPFVPHITEELFQLLRNSKLKTQNSKFESIHQQFWPGFDKKYLEKDQISIVVTIDGKVRDQIVIDKDIVSDKKAVEEKALKSGRVQKFLAKAAIKHVIYVPGKIINIVTGLKI